MITSNITYDKNATQKLIYYSIIGYINALLEHDHSEVDINFVFQPVVTAKRMAQLGYDCRLIDAMLEVDELETICRLGDQMFLRNVSERIINKLLSVIKQVHVSNYQSEASIKKLLWTDVD